LRRPYKKETRLPLAGRNAPDESLYGVRWNHERNGNAAGSAVLSDLI
jgi:hypothetical protein